MIPPTPRERLFRLSLRELFVLCALCVVALVSLRYASDVWQAVVAAIAMTALFVAAVVACVDRQTRQAFAAGFCVSMILYGAVLVGSSLAPGDGRSREFNPDAGRLPTTRVLRPLYAAIAEVRWIDFRTGQEVPNPDSTSGAQASNARFVSAAEFPERGVFMRIGHCWWAMLLGYAGGWFARRVYLRRIDRPETLASGRP